MLFVKSMNTSAPFPAKPTELDSHTKRSCLHGSVILLIHSAGAIKFPYLGMFEQWHFPVFPTFCFPPRAPGPLRCSLPNMAITCSRKHGLQKCHIFFQAHCTVYTKEPEEIPEVIKAYETMQAALRGTGLYKTWLQIWCVGQLKFTRDGLVTL